jgi:hypothetical protein
MNKTAKITILQIEGFIISVLLKINIWAFNHFLTFLGMFMAWFTHKFVMHGFYGIYT